jgi:hypothetical protein
MISSLQRSSLASRERTRPINVAQICVVAASLLTVSGCRTGAQLRPMVRTELFFGLNKEHGGIISDGEWKQFVDEMITPRFPDGFTVIDGAGQYLDTAHQLTCEHSRIVIILHDDSALSTSAIEQLRRVYKSRYDQESVLRVDETVRGGF